MVLVRVAVATSRSVASVARDNYVLTLWTFHHLQQLDYVESLHERGRQLNLGGLVAAAFHDPKRLGDEHRQLQADSGLLPSPDDAKESAQDIIRMVADLDKNEGKAS
jgi:hypothetical protein